MTVLSPAETRCASPSMVKRPVPSSTVTSASPSAVCVLIEGEERHAQGAVLRERLAHDLPLLVFDLVAEAQHLCFFNVFQTHDPISFVLDC